MKTLRRPRHSTYRRKIANLNAFGSTQLHYRNPWVVAWWSAAFPGTGHLLLQKYLRGFLLFIWEMFINTHSQLNLAMVYSFNGHIDRAKEVLDLRWMALYAPVYLFAVFDSYRSAVDMNRLTFLAKREDAPLKAFDIGALEINYLDKRSPWLALVWSLLAPGMGQLYAHRTLNAVFATVTWIVFVYYSKLYLVLHCSLLGQFEQLQAVVDWEWLLYVPSIYFFTAYDAYINTVESNKLFDREMKQYISSIYAHSNVLSSMKP